MAPGCKILFIHSSIDGPCVVFTSWLLQIVLCVCKYLCEGLFSILAGRYLEMELLSHMVILFNFLRNQEYLRPSFHNHLWFQSANMSSTQELNLGSPPETVLAFCPGMRRQKRGRDLMEPLFFSITRRLNYTLNMA